jgi:hypothetical protein
MGEVCTNVGFSKGSEGIFIDGCGVRVVWSVSGSEIGRYWVGYAVLGDFCKMVQIQFPYV